MNILSDKKILITQNSLRHIAGSEMVTLELANYLQSQGAQVTVFTHILENPMQDIFNSYSIRVTTKNDQLSVDDFDYIWVNHQIIPDSILIQLKHKKNLPPFFFYHMSAHEEIRLEQPYIYKLEKKLATHSIFVSEEAKDASEKLFDTFINKPLVLPNFIPEPFSQKHTPSKELRKVLIVSSHPPKELIDSIKLFEKSNIQVDHIGKNSSNYQLITPDTLLQYDCIITIGKTVQYCLGLNIPVYIYDIHGGCGYLSSKNFNKAFYANFSGRDFAHKTPKAIVNDLISHYHQACTYQTTHYEKFLSLLSIKNLDNIFKKSKLTSNKSIFDSSYINYSIAAEAIAREKIQAENALFTSLKKNDSLQSENNNLKYTIQTMENSRAVKIARKIRATKNTIDKILKFNSRPEIILTMCVYNEERNMPKFLTYLEKYIDGIVVVDDNSSDNTVKILQKSKKLLSIIKTDNKHTNISYNERKMRECAIREAKRVAKSPDPFVLCLDPDERPEINFLKDLRKITKKYNHQNQVIAIHFCELWNKINQWRNDGIWQKKVRPLLFQLSNHMTFSFNHQYHVPWAYDEIIQNTLLLEYNLYHLKMIRAKDRKERKELYNKLDPKREIQKIGYDYLDDETNLSVTEIPPTRLYDYESVPDYYKDR